MRTKIRALNSGSWIETRNGERIPLRGNCSMGREPSNTIVLVGGLISRRHALIHSQGGGEHCLVDLGSSNGILLNGRHLKHPTALKDQDQIEIGENILIYRRQSQPEKTACESPAETAYRETIKAQKTAPIWMLIADIKKYTPIAQMLPSAQLARLVGQWIAACKEIIEKNGGEIYQYLGDGFMAYWHDGKEIAGSVARALKELKIIQGSCPPKPREPEAMAGWVKQLEVCNRLPFRLVVHTGTVTLDRAVADGDIGLVGPAMNFAFRMEKLAGKLELDCLASAEAAEQLKQLGPVQPQGSHALAGFEGTHPVFTF